MNPLIGAALVQGGLGSLGSLYDNYQNRKHASNLNHDNRMWQKYVLQNQLRWRVEDAKAAGLHPLVAAGSNPAHGQSTSVFAESTVGRDLAKMGQDISKNVAKASTAKDREFQLQYNAEVLEGAQNKNKLLK